jgi:hypothetical protein
LIYFLQANKLKTGFEKGCGCINSKGVVNPKNGQCCRGELCNASEKQRTELFSG